MVNSDFALAVHALLLLASNGGELINSSRLSKLMKVHPVRIRKLLAKMREKGYIESKEGLHGGFSISCNIANVSLKEIYLLTQDDLLKPKCHECCPSCRIGTNIESVLNGILMNADDWMQEYLGKYNLDKVLKMMKNG